MNRIIKLYTLAGVLAFITTSSCKKLVTVGNPPTGITDNNVYSTDATAAAVLTGVYTNISNGQFANGGLSSSSLFLGLSADELTPYSNDNPMYTAYYSNSLSNGNTGSADFWNNIYPIVFYINSAIEGLGNATSLTPAVQQQLLGESKFMRAFCYFYLVNLYGDVPLVTGTNYTMNEVLPRTSQSLVWAQIISDLKDAEGLLSVNFLDATLLQTTTERVRPTKWAAAALLSRSFLYTKDYADAEAKADTIINNSNLFGLTPLNSVFLAGGTEAIWQLQPVVLGQNTPDAAFFIIPPTGPSDTYPVYLNTPLLNSFEPGDNRRYNWIDSVIINGTSVYYYPYKYKIDSLNAPVIEYEMVFRLGEQYLIRAEARAELGDIANAQSDLNIIRNRAGLTNSTAASQADVISAILHEREVELFTEWGHRWLDLKRTAEVDSQMSTVTPEKNGIWNSYQQWYPISLYELQHDPNLVQNTGF